MFTVSAEVPHAGLSLPTLRRQITAIVADLQIEKSVLSIVIVDDKTIRKLNREYRRKDKPTDVLSFAMREGEFAELSGDLLGDVVVSIETARRQAEEKAKGIQAEVTFLVIHGILHLLGHDHQNDREERAMNRESSRLLKLLSTSAEKPARKAPKKRSAAKKTSRRTQS